MIRSCPSCSAKNRVPAGRLASAGQCGRCKGALPPVAEPIEADPAAFEETVRESQVPVLVDFWAPWCGPCRMSAPEVHELAREMAGRGLVLKVNTEEYPEIAAKFLVQAIPYFILFRNGRVVVQQAGAVPRALMRKWFEDRAYTA